jgi:two-component system, OmpR family, sensor histidine kinase SenX3
MVGRFRPPLFVIAAALVGVMALLATLQYKWLGRITDAERESRKATLNARTSAYASDFDKELTLAYMLFQLEPMLGVTDADESIASRFTARYERWQAAARFPRLIKDCYVATREIDGTSRLQRFNPASRDLEPSEWPAGLDAVRAQIASSQREPPTSGQSQADPPGTFVVRLMMSPLWDEAPAIVVPMPLVLFKAGQDRSAATFDTHLSYTVLHLDRDYITREVLPSLAEQHLRNIGDGVDYQVAVVSNAGSGPVYHSAEAFAPPPDAAADASADLFQVRTQEFAQLAADVKRFTMALPAPQPGHTITAITRVPPGKASEKPSVKARQFAWRESRPLAIVTEQDAAGHKRLVTSIASGIARTAVSQPKWRLLVKHPSGSLEAAVTSTRRRNLLVSSSILAVLAASMTLLVLSARRSQEVARQQMEFVAAVSHELRTPLAVIRSAGDNLADGVVDDAMQIRKYGDLVRSEGRRLSEMVEQILEFAGIQSGQRRFEPRRVDVSALLDSVLTASAALIDAARMTVEIEIPRDLPPVSGDEPALRRVFQNLLGNAIKYGAEGHWIGLRARLSANDIQITVADRGRGIPAAEQARIFEPFYRAADVVAAQIQGAGLGLSLVHRIVEAHGGRVAVKSSPGEGSEFTVHLPARRPEPVPGADARAAEAPRYT